MCFIYAKKLFFAWQLQTHAEHAFFVLVFNHMTHSKIHCYTLLSECAKYIAIVHACAGYMLLDRVSSNRTLTVSSMLWQLCNFSLSLSLKLSSLARGFCQFANGSVSHSIWNCHNHRIHTHTLADKKGDVSQCVSAVKFALSWEYKNNYSINANASS